MDCGHESLYHAKMAMDDLGQWGGVEQAVGGTGGTADNLEEVVIILMVHTHHKHGGIGRRCRDDDPLGTTLQVSPSLLHGSEDPSGLHHILSTSITPLDVGRISPMREDRTKLRDTGYHRPQVITPSQCLLQGQVLPVPSLTLTPGRW